MPTPNPTPTPASESVTIELSAVVIAVTGNEPRVLVVQLQEDAASALADGLPSGPFISHHRTLERGLRDWVQEQTHQQLGYVEQLYTFADRDRTPSRQGQHPVSVSYLALAREARPSGTGQAAWHDWYRYFPWEDWRGGRPALLETIIEPALRQWAAAAPGEAARRERADKIRMAFGSADAAGAPWNEERVLERFELLYEAKLVAEARRGEGSTYAALPDAVLLGHPMVHDHRRILATAIARLRGKIKYRPVVFELMPPSFTLLQLQRVVEGLVGSGLHKQNFRRLVEQCGLVEETGATIGETGGRPAKLVRFRPEVALERSVAGVRVSGTRRG